MGLPGLGCPKQPPKPYPTQTNPTSHDPTDAQPNLSQPNQTGVGFELGWVGVGWFGLDWGWLGWVGIGCVGGRIGSAPLNSRQPTPSQNKRCLVSGPIRCHSRPLQSPQTLYVYTKGRSLNVCFACVKSLGIHDRCGRRIQLLCYMYAGCLMFAVLGLRRVWVGMGWAWVGVELGWVWLACGGDWSVWEMLVWFGWLFWVGFVWVGFG